MERGRERRVGPGPGQGGSARMETAPGRLGPKDGRTVALPTMERSRIRIRSSLGYATVGSVLHSEGGSEEGMGSGRRRSSNVNEEGSICLDSPVGSGFAAGTSMRRRPLSRSIAKTK